MFDGGSGKEGRSVVTLRGYYRSAVVGIALVVALIGPAARAQQKVGNDFLVTNVRVFDGRQTMPSTHVAVTGESFARLEVTLRRGVVFLPLTVRTRRLSQASSTRIHTSGVPQIFVKRCASESRPRLTWA
jgi:hypothetical protein